MDAARYIGRVGGLAVALGVGAAVVAGGGTAYADSPNPPHKDRSGAQNAQQSEGGTTPDSGKPAQAKKSGDKAPLKKLAGILGAHQPTSTGSKPKSTPQPPAGVNNEDSIDSSIDEDETPQRKKRRSWSKPAAKPPIAQRPSFGESNTTKQGLPGLQGGKSVTNVVNEVVAKKETADTEGTVGPVKRWVAKVAAAAEEYKSLAQQSALVTTAPPAKEAAKPAPRFLTALAAAVNDVLHPSAGKSPTTPTDSANIFMLLAAARQRREVAADTANPPEFGTALTVDGLTITPASKMTLTGLYNQATTPPAVNESLQGYQKFTTVDADGNETSFYAYVATGPYLSPYLKKSTGINGTSQVFYVDHNIAALMGPPAGEGSLPDGTVISVTTSLDGDVVHVYSAIPQAGGEAKISDIISYTPTDTNIDITKLVKAIGFDTTRLAPVLPDYITAASPVVVTSMSGLPPLDIALQGYQTFNYLDSDDNVIGRFNAVQTTTFDGLGFATEAFLVTGYPDGEDGEDLPAVGSVFNTISLGKWLNVYSSIPQADGTSKVTNILTNPKGKEMNLNWAVFGYDASRGLVDGTNVAEFNIGKGNDVLTVVAADDPIIFTGVNGLPPLHATIQQTRRFDVMDGNEKVGSFTAEVVTVPVMWLSTGGQALLVTDSNTDEVPVGSIFDIETDDNGWTTTYSDLVGKGTGGKNKITMISTTPNGFSFDVSWLYQDKDASAGLNPGGGLVSYANEPWLARFMTLL